MVGYVFLIFALGIGGSVLAPALAVLIGEIDQDP